MNRKVVLALGVIATALAAFIVFYERDTISSGERDARRGRVAQTFVRARVTDVAITRGDVRIALHRDRAQDLDALELGHWSITEPVRDDADEDAVDSLLTAIEWLEARREIGDVSDDDRATFGLAEPVARVTFRVARDEVEIALGAEDPRGGGVYLAISDRPDRVFVVGRDFLEAVQHDAAHFRDKALFRAFSSRDVERVELDGAETSARFERRAGRWIIVEPFEALARTSAVDDLFSALSEVRATRFLAEDASDLARYGLETPSRALVVVRTPRDDEAQPVRLALRVGGACGDHAGELTALAGDEGPIVCVEEADVAALAASLDVLQERRLSALRDDEVERIDFDADADFSVRRTDGDFLLVEGEAERDADEEAIAAFMRGLRGAEAVAFEPATDEALRARALDRPRATWTFHVSDAERREVLRIGEVGSDGVYVRRGDEPQIARFAPEVAALVTPGALGFRARRLADASEGDARSLRIERDGEVEALARAGGEWTVREPFEMDADRVAVRALVGALATLTAERFVAARAVAEHGLARPRLVIRAEFAPSTDEEDEHAHDDDEEDDDEPARAARTLELRIGAQTEGGAFATLDDDPAVFVVGPALLEAARSRLASRDAIALETNGATRVRVVTSAGAVEITRAAGGAWTSGGAPADEARTTTLLDRLASLRATGVAAYGDAPASAGLAAPRGRVEVEGPTGRAVLSIGALEAGASPPATYARREGTEAVFTIPGDVADTILGYAP